jgi:gluconolactonase
VGDRVYRYEPGSGDPAVVADSFDKPNGLAFSPDESILYVGDSAAPHHIKAFDVVGGRRLANERLFAVIRPGYPDGIKVDSGGRVYSSSAAGVQVFRPSGEPIGRIALPGAVNFTFGGPEGNVLFITSDTAVWAAVLNAKGA